MAALKRPSRNSKIKKIPVENVLCTICQSILVEPVTLPCLHSFCSYCFKGTVENNALCCPLCRKRIGSWLRNAKRQNRLINIELWDIIQKNFSNEIAQKASGTDSYIVEEKTVPVLCKPGEIRSEYEDALQKARKERLSFEQKHAAETELLIRKLQQEDEAQEISRRLRPKSTVQVPYINVTAGGVQQPLGLTVVGSPKHLTPYTRQRLSEHDVESSIVRKKVGTPVESPIMTDDSSSVCSDTVATSTVTQKASASGTRACANFFKDFLDRKLCRVAGSMHDNSDKKVGEKSSKDNVPVTHGTRSLPVSLPYASLMSGGRHMVGRTAVDTDSVDSMKQEFCCFKPINSTQTTTNSMNNKAIKVCSPVRVVGVRPHSVVRSTDHTPILSGPTDLHCSRGHPSAFVSLMKICPYEQEMQHAESSSLKISQCRIGNSVCVTDAAPMVQKRLRTESNEKDTKTNAAISRENLIFECRPAKQSKLIMDSMQKNLSKSTSPEKRGSKVTNPTLDPKLVISSNKNSDFLISSASEEVRTTITESEDKNCSDSLNGSNCLSLTRLTRRTSAARKEYYEQNGTVCSGDKLEQKHETISNRTIKTQLDEDLELALKLDAEWNTPVKTRRYTIRHSDKPKRQLTLPDMMVGGKMKV